MKKLVQGSKKLNFWVRFLWIFKPKFLAQIFKLGYYNQNRKCFLETERLMAKTRIETNREVVVMLNSDPVLLTNFLINGIVRYLFINRNKKRKNFFLLFLAFSLNKKLLFSIFNYRIRNLVEKEKDRQIGRFNTKGTSMFSNQRMLDPEETLEFKNDISGISDVNKERLKKIFKTHWDIKTIGKNLPQCRLIFWNLTRNDWERFVFIYKNTSRDERTATLHLFFTEYLKRNSKYSAKQQKPKLKQNLPSRQQKKTMWNPLRKNVQGKEYSKPNIASR